MWIVTGLAGAALLAGAARGSAEPPPAAPPAKPAPPPPAAPPAKPATPAPAAPAAPAKPPATVNGEVITKADLDLALKAGGPLPMQLTDDQRRQMQMDVLGDLIDRALMRQFVAKNTPPADPKDVGARLASYEAELKKQNKTLQDLYKESNQTEESVRAGVALDLRLENYLKSRVGDAEIEKYYKDNKDFFDKVQVRASHIVLRVPPSAPEADRAKAKAQLADLRAQLVAGKLDFAEAAKKYSQCPSAAGGGDLDYFPRKFVVEEAFAKAAFALKVGEISDVVQTNYGLHLIKATDRKAGEPADFAKIKDDVRFFCTEEARMDLLGKLRKDATIDITLP
jgi:parvulin-like peptidyl-prolyl isomerase